MAKELDDRRETIKTFTRTRPVTWAEIDAFAAKNADYIRANFTLLVAILRGGAPVAAALSRATGLPVDYILCSARRPRVEFADGAEHAPRGHKILLVDDISGTGWTFKNCAEYAASFGNEVKTASIYYCDAPGMFRPDIADPMGADIYLRWPWEYQDEPEMPQGT